MSKRLTTFPTILALLAFLITASCWRQSGSSGNVDYWTCTMHPSVHSKDPGKCPICSMDLVPVMKGGATPASSGKNAPQHDHAAMLAGKLAGGGEMQGMPGMPGMKGGAEGKAPQTSEFVVPVDRQQQIGVSYARDEAKTVAARETPDRLIQSAKRRLQLWNVTEEQIAELEKSRRANETLTLLSPFRGVVQSVPVDQGKSVKVGDLLVEVADLSVVWVWADFYENELSMLQLGQKIPVTAKSYPGEKFDGTISLINPFIDEAKRTAKVRIDIPNPNFKLPPGRYR